jgi:predicted permease
VDAGFTSANIMTLRVSVPPGTVSRDSMPGYYEGIRARAAAVPGVTDAALADCPPVAGGCNATIMTFADRPPSTTGNAVVGVHWVTPNWFRLMSVPLKRGRYLDPSDQMGTARVIVINEAAAKKYFPGEDPLGKRVSVFQGGFDKGATIVGIVGDVRFGTIDSTARPDAYISYGQSPPRRAMLFLRTLNDPASVVPSVRAALKEVAPASPIFDIRSMDSRVASATGQARLSATLLGLFALLALALAVMGIYGVISFAVAQRTREIGIRVAIGADCGEVAGLFMREGFVMGGAGIAIGLAGAFALTRVMRSLLFNVAPDDFATFGTIVAVVFAATLLATWIPARRAARLDPVEALR